MRIHFHKAAHSYDVLLRRVKKGRAPYTAGKPLNSATRAFLRDDPDYPAPVIDLYNHKTKFATVYPDNIMEFTQTERGFWSIAQSLTQVLGKVVPCYPHNFAKGRYRIITNKTYDDYLPKDRTASWRDYRETYKHGQEYFQHLKLNLTTGEIVNAKDMTPVVNEEKRKQWLAGLKQFRVKLRAMARLGLFDGRDNIKSYIGSYIEPIQLNYLAEAIMRGDCDEECQRILVNATSTWRSRRTNKPYSMTVLDTFENTVKSNSRDMRNHVGVIDLQK